MYMDFFKLKVTTMRPLPFGLVFLKSSTLVENDGFSMYLAESCFIASEWVVIFQERCGKRQFSHSNGSWKSPLLLPSPVSS